jgi:hypothetical protein
MSNKKLQEVRDWALAMSYSQREPRWMWQRYKDLVAMIDGILASQAATIVQEDESGANSAMGHDWAENIISLDDVRRGPPDFSVRLAM